MRTWQQACLCKTLSKVIVATDDERIAEACRQEGAEVVMTSVSCANGATRPSPASAQAYACSSSLFCFPLCQQHGYSSKRHHWRSPGMAERTWHGMCSRCAGTERCHEAVTKMPGEYDIVINIQGDEPLIDPHVIDDTVKALQDTPDSMYRSACFHIVGSECHAISAHRFSTPSSSVIQAQNTFSQLHSYNTHAKSICLERGAALCRAQNCSQSMCEAQKGQALLL